MFFLLINIIGTIILIIINKIRKIVNVKFLVIYPFVYEKGKVTFQPLKLLASSKSFNNSLYSNLANDLALIDRVNTNNLMKKLFLTRLIGLILANLIIGGSLIIMFQLSIIFVFMIELIGFIVLQFMSFYGWEGDYAVIKDKKVSEFLLEYFTGEYTLYYLGQYFVDNIKKLNVEGYNEELNNYLLQYLYRCIYEAKIVISADELEKVLKKHINNFFEKITFKNVEMYLEHIQLHRMIGIVGVLNQSNDYVNLSKELVHSVNEKVLNDFPDDFKIIELLDKHNIFLSLLDGNKKGIKMKDYIILSNKSLFRYGREIENAVKKVFL